MKLFTVKLSETHREMLEAIRRNEGLRSESEVIRMLIERHAGSGLPTRSERAEIKRAAESLGSARVGVASPAVAFGPVERKPGSLLKGSKK